MLSGFFLLLVDQRWGVVLNFVPHGRTSTESLALYQKDADRDGPYLTGL